VSGDVPDVVIPVRPGDDNEELRYALRSLRLLPHRRVWIAGYLPGWVRNVGHVHVRQQGTKYRNSTANLVAACRNGDVAEDFVLWNDDFFLLGPVERVEPMHRGEVRDVHAYYAARYRDSDYMRGMRMTADILWRLGVKHPLSYELHVPMPMTKSGFLEAHAKATVRGMPAPVALHKRTLYGNLAELGGERVEDVKVWDRQADWAPGPLPYVSTTESIFSTHPAGAHVRELHSEPGPYESAASAPRETRHHGTPRPGTPARRQPGWAR
jgi:hypothetical protein